MKILNIILLFFVIILLSSCASIFSKPNQSVRITSSPSGKAVYVNEIYQGVTPVNIILPRSNTPHRPPTTIRVGASTRFIHQKLNPMVLGNLGLAFLTSLIVANPKSPYMSTGVMATGLMVTGVDYALSKDKRYRYPNNLHYNLSPPVLSPPSPSFHELRDSFQELRASRTSPPPSNIQNNIVIPEAPPRDYDTIILKNGNRIYVLLTEISSKEIRYRLNSQPDGPLRIISVSSVSQIRHRNGNVENIKNNSSFGLIADPGGFIGSGPETGFEITSGNANYQFIARFPSLGASNNFSAGIDVNMSINYLYNANESGFYLGAVGGYRGYYLDHSKTLYSKGILLGATGYRIVFDSGYNMRFGIGFGASFGNSGGEFIWRPVSSIGYSF